MFSVCICTQCQGAGAGVGDEQDPVEAHRDQHWGQGGERDGHDLFSGKLTINHSRLTSLEFMLYGTVLNNRMITDISRSFIKCRLHHAGSN